MQDKKRANDKRWGTNIENWIFEGDMDMKLVNAKPRAVFEFEKIAIANWWKG